MQPGYVDGDEPQARKELKRIDHLIFVTLKYTRTVDVIRNIIKRLIICLDAQVDDFYEYALENNKKVKEIPSVPLIKVKNLEKIFPKNKDVKDFVDFYVFLKTTYNSAFKKKEEYRKNVALVTPETEVNIERLKILAEQTKDFVFIIEGLMQ